MTKNWKSWPYWVKGGVLAFIMCIVITILSFLIILIDGTICMEVTHSGWEGHYNRSTASICALLLPLTDIPNVWLSLLFESSIPILPLTLTAILGGGVAGYIRGKKKTLPLS